MWPHIELDKRYLYLSSHVTLHKPAVTQSRGVGSRKWLLSHKFIHQDKLYLFLILTKVLLGHYKFQIGSDSTSPQPACQQRNTLSQALCHLPSPNFICFLYLHPLVKILPPPPHPLTAQLPSPWCFLFIIWDSSLACARRPSEGTDLGWDRLILGPHGPADLVGAD